MIPTNLRHLRIFLAIGETKSVSKASQLCGVSQPAATQALNKIERDARRVFFERTPHGLFATADGQMVLARVGRAVERLDKAMDTVGARLRRTATFSRLRALAAVAEAESFSLAARRTGLSQPSLHRAVSQIEKDADKPLFKRTSHGLIPTRRCQDLSLAIRLAEAELDQSISELAASEALDSSRIVVGALPLSRSGLLPKALARFRTARPKILVTVIDGSYDDLLKGLRRGEIDVIVGALRDPVPTPDVHQEVFFEDSLIILARPGHDLLNASRLPLAELVAEDWVVPRTGTPARREFDRIMVTHQRHPRSIIETGSILLMRELLYASDMLGCISRQQAEAEVSRGLLVEIAVDHSWSRRPIGLTTRKDFVPTTSQALLLDLLRSGLK